MAYSKKQLEKEALEAINKYNLFFIEDIVAYISCSERTFYNKKMQELQSIQEAINRNKIKTKGGIRNKWYNSSHPSSQKYLYSLIGSEDEVHRLNGTKQEIKHSIEQPIFKLDDLSLDD